MGKIAIIQDTGNSQVNSIFKGVWGKFEGGVFNVAPELKAIHLFNLLTPQAMAASGIELGADAISEVEMSENAAPGLIATLAKCVADRWDKTYATALNGFGQANIASAAVAAERANVASTMQNILEGYTQSQGLSPANVLLEANFEDYPGDAIYSDGDGDGDGDVEGYSASAKAVLSSQGFQWQLAVTANTAPSEVKPYIESSNLVAPMLSGKLDVQLNVYGSDQDNRMSVAEAVASLPKSLRAIFLETSEVSFKDALWHAWQAERLVQNDTPVLEAPGVGG